MFDEIFLAVIVSLDIFLVAASYSSSGIKIPLTSAAAISLISSAILGISLKFSEIISLYIPEAICCICGLVVLTAIGIVTVFKSIVRSIVKKLADKESISLKMNSLGIVVKLYLDDTAADFDKSKSLSLSEAAALALASSLDSAATGLNSGMLGLNALIASVFAFITGCLAIFAGAPVGRKISSPTRDFSWVGGVLLIAFAVYSYIS